MIKWSKMQLGTSTMIYLIRGSSPKINKEGISFHYLGSESLLIIPKLKLVKVAI